MVSYSPERDTVCVHEITVNQGDEGRYTIMGLLSALGLTTEVMIQLYLKNNNLHDAQKAMKGALLYLSGRIGLVVKSEGTHILFQVLLPCRWKDKFYVVDLRKENRHEGFFLQQVRGFRPASLQAKFVWKRKKAGVEYPYMKNGYVFMDPLGPDFCIPSAKIPIDVQNKFNAMPDNLCLKDYSPISFSDRNLRKCKSTMVVYVVDSKTRVDIVKQRADCFYVPVGATTGHVKCPWKNNDGTHSL